MKVFLFFFLLFTWSHLVFGQKYRYDKVDKELLLLKRCDFDTNASAMVTYIAGFNDIPYFEFDNEFKLKYSIKKQIKIFNNDGKSKLGDIELVFYSPAKSENKVKLKGFKGKVYNLVDGQIKETKIKDENIFISQIDKFRKRLAVAVPDLTDHSVFEYEYEILSDYISNIEDWEIQADFPTVYNEVCTYVPEYLNFQLLIKGFINPTENKNTSQQRNFKYFGITYNKIFMSFNNISAFEEENLSLNPQDFRASVSYQIINISWPDRPTKDIAGGYPEMVIELMFDESFGLTLFKGEYINEKLVFPADSDTLSKIKLVYDYFRNNCKWNGYHSYWTDMSMEQLFKIGRGSIGDINLHYVAALKHLGISAAPVILSTIGHGGIHPVYPYYGDFNYVIACTYVGGKAVLSDAASGLSFGLLPLKCYNREGYVISEEISGWLPLNKDVKSKQVIQTEVSLLDDHLLYKSTFQNSENYLVEKELWTEDKIEKEKSYISDILREFEVDSVQHVEPKPNQLRIIANYKNSASADENLYIKPFNFLPFPANSFEKTTRNTMVEIPMPIERKYIISIAVPDSHIVEMPTSINVSLDQNNSIIFKFSPSYVGETKVLTIVADFKMNQWQFKPDQYEDLKNFYKLVTNKLGELIVLKKKE